MTPPRPHAGDPVPHDLGRPSRPELGLVLGLTAIALFLRLRGIDFVLPCMPLSDSFPLTQQIDFLRGKPWITNFDPDLIPYPQLLGRLTSFLPAPPDHPLAPGAPIEEHVRLASEPWRQIRLVAAAISVLIVPGTWLLARRFLSRASALLAAALVATSLMHVNFAVHEKPHGPLSGVIAFAAVSAILLRRRADVPAYLLAGAVLGLAAATLHSGVFALPMLAAAVVLREKRAGSASILWGALSVGIVLAFVNFSYPALFQEQHDQVRVFQDGEHAVLQIPGGNEIYLPLMRGGGFGVVVAGLWSNDPILFAGLALGLAAVAWGLATRTLRVDRGRRLDLCVVLAFVVPYFAILGVFDNTEERYVPPLLPFVACLAAYGFERAFAAARERLSPLRARPVAPVLAAALPAIAFVPAWWLGLVRQERDTFTVAADVLTSAARPEEDTIVIPSALDLPLLHTESALALNAIYPQRSNWVRYQMRTPAEVRTNPRYGILIAPGPAPEVARRLREDPIAYFEEHHARFVVMPTLAYFDIARSALRRRGELVGRIVPERVDRPGRETLFTYQHGHNDQPWSEPFFATVLSMRRTGQTLEIYRLGEPAR